MDKVNILLVDDQPAKLLSYQTILAELGENLVLARSGREALQYLLKQEVALILLDVIMPEMDGFETATWIRQHPRLERTPIIFVTALSTSDLDRLKGYALGAVDYVFVPIVPEILRAKVSVFVELFRKRQELQNLNRTLEEERASLARRIEERTAELSLANAELARAARMKDEFLASMSHELRTPLNAVLGLCEALQEQIYGLLNEKQLKALSSIEESGRHLLVLINDILDLSKIEAGKLKLEISPVSVDSVCQASLRLINQIANKKQLKVSSSFDNALTIIHADGRHLKQILVNLLSNAVKFTSEGGTIGLEVAGNMQQGMIHFIVWDTGIGISPGEMQRLFQPFVQLDSSLSRQYPGTGLGLALVRRLVELHGGGVRVESEPGKGSRFTVSLPWQAPVESFHTGESAKAIPISTSTRRRVMIEELPYARPTHLKTQLTNAESVPVEVTFGQELNVEPPLILLAEDNECSITTLSDYLLARRYRVVVARNGSEAIACAKEKRPNVILMDIQMPGMDGLEATHRIRTDGELASVPIIALTALAMPGDRERCLQAGANDYMSKPISLKNLITAIEQQLHQN